MERVVSAFDQLTHDQFKRAVALYNAQVNAAQRLSSAFGTSEVIYSNEHGDIVILRDPDGRQIARVGLDTGSVIID